MGFQGEPCFENFTCTKMKKFKGLLAKGKQKQDKFYNIYEASLCDSASNFTPKNIYKNFMFDSDCFHIKESECNILLSPRADLNNSQDSAAYASPKSHIFTSALTETFDLQLENNFRLVKSKPNSSSSFDSLHEYFSPFESQQRKFQEKQENKLRKKMYVITISNSKCFNIGSKKTININNKDPWQSNKAQSDVDKHIPYLKYKLNELLDCQEKLSEEGIMLISLNLDNQWKKFVKYLELEEKFFEELEARNDQNRIFIVYDALQKFKNKYPNTSFGFIINVLCHTHQLAVIEKLTKEFNSVL